MSASPMNSLREENKLMAALLDILKQEQTHLVAAEIDALASLTAEKSALVSQMAQLSQQRNAALGAAGFPAREAGMDDWIAATGGGEAGELWQALLATTQEARELNRINGMLINRQMQYTQGALQALRPPQAAAAVYGPSGHTTSSAKSRGFLAG